MRFRIKEVREEKGISQRELAKRANVSRVTIHELERGKKGAVMTSALERIAEALGVEVGEIWK